MTTKPPGEPGRFDWFFQLLKPKEAPKLPETTEKVKKLTQKGPWFITETFVSFLKRCDPLYLFHRSPERKSMDVFKKVFLKEGALEKGSWQERWVDSTECKNLSKNLYKSLLGKDGIVDVTKAERVVNEIKEYFQTNKISPSQDDLVEACCLLLCTSNDKKFMSTTFQTSIKALPEDHVLARAVAEARETVQDGTSFAERRLRQVSAMISLERQVAHMSKYMAEFEKRFETTPESEEKELLRKEKRLLEHDDAYLSTSQLGLVQDAQFSNLVDMLSQTSSDTNEETWVSISEQIYHQLETLWKNYAPGKPLNMDDLRHQARKPTALAVG